MPPSRAHVWFVEVDDEGAAVQARAMLPAADADRLSATAVPRHRHRRLCAQAALRALVADAVGSTPLLVRLERDRNGKPQLADGSDLHVSLTHSGAFAAVALTTAGPVGVDIEQPHAVPDQAALARTMMSDREYQRWLRLAGPAAARSLFRSWTYKEAVLKAFGAGLAGDVRAVATRPGSNGQPVLETLHAAAGTPARWTLRDLSDECGLPAAVAVAAPETEIRFRRARISDILRTRVVGLPSRSGPRWPIPSAW